jgi:hypothetical protein
MSDVHESFASMSMKTRGRHGCDHMVTELPMQSVPIITIFPIISGFFDSVYIRVFTQTVVPVSV